MSNLPDDVIAHIRKFVLAGFESASAIQTIVCEELYDADDLDPDAVAAEIAVEISILKRESQNWPAMTDFDRLDRVFVQLRRIGFIALHNAGVTLSDGESDVAEAFHVAKNKKDLVGYCFYHLQDIERAIDGDGLNLAFGCLKESPTADEVVNVGRQIIAQLRSSSLHSEWNESPDRRIEIKPFKWQRRRL